MHMIVVGLNYRTAPVEIREKFAFAEQDLPEALRQLQATKSILECVIVSTCNRTEIYAVVDRLYMCGYYIRSYLERWFGIPREYMKDYLYMYEDQPVIEHLFKVTCGLDSMVIGETQILGQVRDAFLRSQEEKATGTIFNRLFKQAVTLGKRAHAETAIGENPVSVSYAAVELGKRIFGHFRSKTVMIVGAGKMSELTLKHLTGQGADRLLVVNRTMAKAEELAERMRGTAVPMEQMLEAMKQVDVVISSTGSADYVLVKQQIQRVMTSRKSRPLFMIDIAVPRDLDPEISKVPNVYLYDIDDLQLIVETNLNERRKEAVKIEAMIREELASFDQWFKLLGVGPVIQALQEKANDIHRETMDNLMLKLTDLDEREAKVIRKLTKSMMNQMMRDPILRVKELAGERHGDQTLALFTDLFALEARVADLKAEAAKLQDELKKAGDAAKEDHVFSGGKLQERSSKLKLPAGEMLAGS
ncbi:glutamyl-tRNA reductase [Paenibacillus koleovorans]|uniref:glutamyl-tRNA reductase n=1 Tax=Paenibacillus koleovorans TaxID=121608 RepID=UPI000FD92374|nr:glutamyl-tRNA reductase [Paenibacillus koleovorans]